MESLIAKKIQIAISKIGARIFRNNVGTAWTGTEIIHMNKDVIIKNARIIRFGLGVGSSDYIGWHSVKITDKMVGKTIAVFTACEVKTLRGRPTKEQLWFIDAVNQAGGIAFIARSEDEAVNKIQEGI